MEENKPQEPKPLTNCRLEEGDFKCKNPEHNHSDIPQVEKDKIERANKEKFVLDRMKELRELWHYLESIYGNKNRKSRKDFRRRFISEDRFGSAMMQDCINYYERKKQ